MTALQRDKHTSVSYVNRRARLHYRRINLLLSVYLSRSAELHYRKTNVRVSVIVSRLAAIAFSVASLGSRL